MHILSRGLGYFRTTFQSLNKESLIKATVWYRCPRFGQSLSVSDLDWFHRYAHGMKFLLISVRQD